MAPHHSATSAADGISSASSNPPPPPPYQPDADGLLAGYGYKALSSDLHDVANPSDFSGAAHKNLSDVGSWFDSVLSGLDHLDDAPLLDSYGGPWIHNQPPAVG